MSELDPNAPDYSFQLSERIAAFELATANQPDPDFIDELSQIASSTMRSDFIAYYENILPPPSPTDAQIEVYGDVLNSDFARRIGREETATYLRRLLAIQHILYDDDTQPLNDEDGEPEHPEGQA